MTHQPRRAACPGCGRLHLARFRLCAACARPAATAAAAVPGHCVLCAAPILLGGARGDPRDICGECRRARRVHAPRFCALDGLPLAGHPRCVGCTCLVGEMHATASAAACPCGVARRRRRVAA